MLAFVGIGGLFISALIAMTVSDRQALRQVAPTRDVSGSVAD